MLRVASIHIILLAWALNNVSAFASLSAGRSVARQTRSTLPSYHRGIIPKHKTSSLVRMALTFPRGGGGGIVANAASSPQSLFNFTLLSLAITTVLVKVLQKATAPTIAEQDRVNKPASIRALQTKFLPVFWLLRCADWLQGPYFYEVYASKVFNGVQASMSLVSRLFLTGFASTAVFGPSVGRAADQYGRKKATIAFSLIYAAGALSTKSPFLVVLFLGRVLSGIGTSLLFSAPESWLVGEAQKSGDDPDGKYLGETFGLAYAGDSIVAILAGQMAGMAALRRGSTGPFELSTAILIMGGLLTSVLWKENAASRTDKSESNTIRDAVQVVKKDPKIMLVGIVQSLFEAAMYIFVLQWPPAMAKAIALAYGQAAVPYGAIFSCFMACCLLGSTLFGQFAKMGVTTESFTLGMLSIATIAMSSATWITSSGASAALTGLMAAFFAFEACVGMYFPSIGTLRSKYVPDSHRSVIMNLFGIPLNVLVVSVFLSIQKLGVTGALSISSGGAWVGNARHVSAEPHNSQVNFPSLLLSFTECLANNAAFG